MRKQLPLPLYSGGEGWGEGGRNASLWHDDSARHKDPLTHGPSPPEYRGRGEKNESKDPPLPEVEINPRDEYYVEPEE